MAGIAGHAALLEPDFIPIEIFKRTIISDGEQLEDLVNALQSLSLAEFKRVRGSIGISVHRLAQEESHRYGEVFPEEAPLLCRPVLIVVLSELMPEVEVNPDQEWERAKRYVSHAQKILEIDQVETLEEADLNRKIGLFNTYVTQDFSKALKFHEHAFKIRQQLSTSSEPEKLLCAQSLIDIGVVYGWMRESEKAIEYHHSALTLLKDIYQEEDHLEIVRAMYYVADIHWGKSRFYEAISSFKTALEIRDRLEVSPNSNPCKALLLTGRGKSWGALGLSMMYQMETDKALAYFENALNDFEGALQAWDLLLPGQNNVEIAKCLAYKGLLCVAQGRVEEALNCSEQSDKMMKALYGSQSQDYLVQALPLFCKTCISLYKKEFLNMLSLIFEITPILKNSHLTTKGISEIQKSEALPSWAKYLLSIVMFDYSAFISHYLGNWSATDGDL